MLIRSFIILCIGVLLSAENLYAQADEVRQYYNGARSWGMGGAGIAVVNDETSLLINPSGLGKLRDIYGTVFDPELEGSANWTELYRATPFSNPVDPDKVADTVIQNPGNHFHAKAQFFPSFVVRNFGVGILARRVLDARVDSPGLNYSQYYQDDLALLLGFNFKLFGGRVKLGATGKVISRIEMNNTIPIATGTFGLDANASEGVGVGFDAGLTLSAPWAWLPTISAVARDIGGTKYDSASGVRRSSATRPATVAQDLDLAVALFPIHSNKSRSSFTIEAQKLQAMQVSSDKMKYAHIGYEYNYADLLFLRAGMNQRYWTAGFEIASERFQIQYSYYGVDIGPDGAPEEDRRWVWKISYRF